MTTLPEALRALAPDEKAFKDFRYSNMTGSGKVTGNGFLMLLKWLGDREYITYTSKSGPDRKVSIWKIGMEERVTGYGDTLPAALAQAVVALWEAAE